MRRRPHGCSSATHGRLARVGDPRARRNRAYALLARNGFDPEVAAAASRAIDLGSNDAAVEDLPEA